MIFSDIEVLFLKRLINIISSIILLILILIIIVIFAPKLFSIARSSRSFVRFKMYSRLR